MPRNPLKTIKDLVDLSPAKWHNLGLRKSSKRAQCSFLGDAMVSQIHLLTPRFLSVFSTGRDSLMWLHMTNFSF